MGISVAKIFTEKPKQWGLRGDPYLWAELENHFARIYDPLTEEEFHKEFYRAFQLLTGEKFGQKEHFHVAKYHHGGMSSGMINPEFWIDIALPMLTERLKGINNSGQTI